MTKCARPAILSRAVMTVTMALAAFVLIAAATGPAMAQNSKPDLPEPLQNLVNEGAQAEYLGSFDGLDGWVTILNGQESYFYVTESGESFLMGLLYDKTGKVVTLRQVQALQNSEEGDTLDLLAADRMAAQQQAAAETASRNKDFKTPAERLFHEISQSNWVALGNPGAPAIYSFIDPQCPHCHDFIEALRPDYIENGLVQVRMVPVGFNPETQAQAAFLLAAGDPEQRWYDHLAGDAAALPVRPDINQQGVQRNLSLMQSWKLNATPTTIYRAESGQVKILQGQPQSLPALMNDLP